jgi:putative ABC transport system permease protein
MKRLVSLWRNVTRRGVVEQDLDDELRSVLEMLVEEKVAAGMTREAACRAARLELGSDVGLKENVRDVRQGAAFDVFLQDARYALRQFRREPVFTLTAVVTLALGIGANTAIFSLMDAVTLRSLPVTHPEQLVALTRDPANTSTGTFSNPTWEQLRDRPELFAGALAYSGASFNLAQRGEARPIAGNWVSGGFFDVLGVRALTGRLLHTTDDVRGCPGVVAVSAGFAEREYGAVDSAVGRTVSLGGQKVPIVGVIDPGFTGVTVGTSVDIYAPLCAQAIVDGDPTILDQTNTLSLTILGRLPEGMSIDALQARLKVAGPEHLAAIPAAGGISRVRQTYRQALAVLMIVVGLVLVIACANIANLLLARTAARGREMAIRLAIGAGRGRLIRQLLTESLMLSLAGAAIGVIFAQWAARLLVGYLSTTRQPIVLDLAINPSVLAFASAIAILTGVLFGLAPSWRAARANPHLMMKADGRGAARGDGVKRVGRTLVAGQVALSLALVTGAGLLVGSFRTLDTLDPGFQREGILLAQLNFTAAGLNGPAQAAAARDVLERIRQIPGVEAASLSMLPPLGAGGLHDDVIATGFEPAGKEDAVVFFNGVSEGYFGTLRTALRSGRDISPEDVNQGRRVAVINETMLRRVFGSVSALGKQFQLPEGDGASAPIEVVGVVQDAKHDRLDETTSAMAFVPHGVIGPPLGTINYEIRSMRPRAEVVREITNVVAVVSPGITERYSTLSEAAEGALTRPRMLAVLSAFFGGLALLLAMIGLHGTMAYSVVQRRNEIGVRIALGAERSGILRMVTADAARIVVAGVVLGVLLTLGGTRFLSAFLFGVTPTDPATLLASALALIITGLGAAAVPAWRGAKLDPIKALREE